MVDSQIRLDSLVEVSQPLIRVVVAPNGLRRRNGLVLEIHSKSAEFAAHCAVRLYTNASLVIPA